MSLIDNIVKVVITRATAGVTRAGFGVAMFLSEFLSTVTNPAFTERVRLYSSADALLDDGFADNSIQYLAAVSYFSQPVKPTLIAIGRKLTGGEGSETYTAALNACKDEYNDFYGVSIDSRITADQLLLAAWAESQKVKLAGMASDDGVIITAGTTDIAYEIKDNSYFKSFAKYNPDSDGTNADPFPEMAWFGRMFPFDPGSSTWGNQTLSGITSYILTDSEYNYAIGKNCNVYQTVAGKNIVLDGKVGGGEWIDIIRGIDWLTVRLQEDVFEYIYNITNSGSKIPYTNPGIASLEAVVKGRLDNAIAQGVLASYTTTAPDARLVLPAYKIDRLLPDLNFTGILAGAIQKTEINGVVSV